MIQAAALILPPGAALSGKSAAFAYKADIYSYSDDIEATAPRGALIRHRAGLRVLQAELPTEDVVRISGVPVTSPLRTAFDLARRWPLGTNPTEYVVAVDAVANRCSLDTEQILKYAALQRFKGWRGVRNLETVIRYLEPKAESPQESRLRMRIIYSGLPKPVAQFHVYSINGEFIARLDLAWPELKLGAEYDGECHAITRISDNDRHNRLRAAGWQVFTYTRADMRPDGPIIDQLRAAITARSR